MRAFPTSVTYLKRTNYSNLGLISSIFSLHSTRHHPACAYSKGCITKAFKNSLNICSSRHVNDLLITPMIRFALFTFISTCVSNAPTPRIDAFTSFHNCTARQCSPLRRKFMECYIIKPAQSLFRKHLVIGQG